jgi:hypothetical protein
MKKYNVQTLAANTSAAAVSDEVISSIRNAIAFNTQEKLAKQYDMFLASAERSGFRLGIAISFLLATCMTIVELTYVRNSLSLDFLSSIRLISGTIGTCILARVSVSCGW